jgi:hypothetical protein
MGLNSQSRNVLVGIAFSVLLASVAVPSSMTGAAYATASANLTVNGYSLDGKTLNMSITIQNPDGSTATNGFTPLTFSGMPNKTYTVVASDYAANNIYFDHWSNGSTNKSTTVTLKGSMTLNAYYKTTTTTTTTTHNLMVNALSSSGSSLGMYTTISSATGTVVKTGYTPLAYTGTAGATYTVSVSNYGSYTFDHWQDGSTTNPRTFALNADMTETAYYNSSTTTTTSSSSSTTSIQTLVPKTGILVSLYMYPGSTGSTYWQQVIDQKLQHPSVPIVAVFNPSSGPGTSKDSNIAAWVAKLQSAGVLAIGYKSDNYATTSLADLEAAANSYKNWYNADGLFIDEFTNKAGYETHYSSLTSYAKSIGMKITVGNPGTDVPPSYIGTVDVINTSEGSGYISLSDPNLIGSNWVSGGYLGWHQAYDKRNFSYVRYGISSLDTTFEVNSSQYVGLLYLTDGTDSNGRWFSLPSYYNTEVATLDK